MTNALRDALTDAILNTLDNHFERYVKLPPCEITKTAIAATWIALIRFGARRVRVDGKPCILRMAQRLQMSRASIRNYVRRYGIDIHAEPWH